MFIRDNIQFNLREDLSIFIEGEFEYIFVESVMNGQTSSVGEMYHIAKTSVTYVNDMSQYYIRFKPSASKS